MEYPNKLIQKIKNDSVTIHDSVVEMGELAGEETEGIEKNKSLEAVREDDENQG
jgi:hypothetical protein